MHEPDDTEQTQGHAAPGPISAIFPSETEARVVLERLRRLAGCDGRCFLLSPKAPSHALATLRDKVRLPAPQRRRALVVATATGTLLGLLCAVAAVPFETSWQVDIPFLVLGSLAVAGPIIGLVAGVVWNRRVALHRALDSVRLSLQHGHWGIVALPATRRQWRQIAGLLRQGER
jgi:hypothetical protein